MVLGYSHKKQDARLDVAEHADELLLSELETGDWFAELDTVHGVLVRLFKSTSHCASEDEGNCQTRLHQAGIEASLEVVGLGQSVVIRHKDVLEFDNSAIDPIISLRNFLTYF
jgi:hypothetical protein